jgi:hypothetical protein
MGQWRGGRFRPDEVMKTCVKENLLGCHVVAVEDGGKNAGLGVDTLIFPDLLAISEVRVGKVAVRAGRVVSTAGSARRFGRACPTARVF